MMEARTAEFAELTGGRDAVERAIDRWVWYAGFADKLAQVLGSSNPVAGPYFNFSFPEPTGVVGVVAPDEPPLLGLVSRIAPAIVGGNTVVAIASETHPLAAVELAEVLATSDLPGGTVNLLTGSLDRTAATLASHMDVNAIDLTGLAADAEQATALGLRAEALVEGGDDLLLALRPETLQRPYPLLLGSLAQLVERRHVELAPDPRRGLGAEARQAEELRDLARHLGPPLLERRHVAGLRQLDDLRLDRPSDPGQLLRPTGES
jgi:hypothetical protein